MNRCHNECNKMLCIFIQVNRVKSVGWETYTGKKAWLPHATEKMCDRERKRERERAVIVQENSMSECFMFAHTHTHIRRAQQSILKIMNADINLLLWWDQIARARTSVQLSHFIHHIYIYIHFVLLVTWAHGSCIHSIHCHIKHIFHYEEEWFDRLRCHIVCMISTCLCVIAESSLQHGASKRLQYHKKKWAREKERRIQSPIEAHKRRHSYYAE